LTNNIAIEIYYIKRFWSWSFETGYMLLCREECCHVQSDWKDLSKDEQRFEIAAAIGFSYIHNVT